jgi:secernin
MVLALGRATASGRAVFGHNSHLAGGQKAGLVRSPGRQLAVGEMVAAKHVQLPQVRQTYTVLGSQPEACWGFAHGVNDQHVAVGCGTWDSKLTGGGPGLTGADLTRLALERSRSARQAVDVLTDLIARHGQASAAAPAGGDHVFLVADPSEAFALEAAGRAWVVQEIHAARAAADMAVVRQDWDRIAAGAAEDAIARGWWEADGSKLDFAGALAASPTGDAVALRRWGRATLLLERESGRITSSFVRRLLADHFQGTRYEMDPVWGSGEPAPLCRHGAGPRGLGTTASLVVELTFEPAAPAMAWCAFGPPCVSVYFPVFLDVELPTAFADAAAAQHLLCSQLGPDSQRWRAARQRLEQLQADFARDEAEFAAEAAELLAKGWRDEVGRRAGLLMQSHVERFRDAADALCAQSGRRTPPAVPQLHTK